MDIEFLLPAIGVIEVEGIIYGVGEGRTADGKIIPLVIHSIADQECEYLDFLMEKMSEEKERRGLTRHRISWAEDEHHG